MLSVGALAIGYLVMNIFSTSANVSGDVCSNAFWVNNNFNFDTF